MFQAADPRGGGRYGGVDRRSGLGHHLSPSSRPSAGRDLSLCCERLDGLSSAAPIAAQLWPRDRAARAMGRSAAAEMHAGFASLRGECPMDLGLRTHADLSAATQGDLRRIVELWNGLLSRFGGPFLLGAWSIA